MLKDVNAYDEHLKKEALNQLVLRRAKELKSMNEERKVRDLSQTEGEFPQNNL